MGKEAIEKLKKSFITELNTKLYNEKELDHMSTRDKIPAKAINEVITKLKDWVNGK